MDKTIYSWDDDRTARLIEERAQTYGDPLDSHTAIGQAWGAILTRAGMPCLAIPPRVVALMMAAFKLCRAATPGFNEDDYDDAHAYVVFAQSFHESQGNAPSLHSDPPRASDAREEPEATGDPFPRFLVALKAICGEAERVEDRGLPREIPSNPRSALDLPRCLMILTEEVGEVAADVQKATSPKNDARARWQHYKNLQQELTQVAGVALAWLQETENTPC